MTETWRLLRSGHGTAFTNMAVDRAILEAHSKGLVPPTVRFYGWSPPAISIGYFQSMAEEVDTQECRRRGIDCVRRITGGGAVYHDAELTYSIVVSEDHPRMPSKILDSYATICQALIDGLRTLEIEPSFSPINDIVVCGKKISGNAQTRKLGAVLQHGTILLDVDVDAMFSVLKVPNEKIKDKLITDVKARVTSLRHELGHEVPFDTVAAAMRQGFEQAFAVTLTEGTLTEEERRNAHRFEQECFARHEWNHRR